MQAHVRNDVQQSVGLVVNSEWLECVDVYSEWLECVDVSSIPRGVEAWNHLGCYKLTSVDLNVSILLVFFIACILLVEKAVTRTSKTLIAGVLLTYIIKMYQVPCRGQSLLVEDNLSTSFVIHLTTIIITRYTNPPSFKVMYDYLEDIYLEDIYQECQLT
jgi:hypothetical protein